MRITLLVFSQTGNTLRVAEAVADTLEAHGHEVLLLRTSLFAPDETELPDTDLVIVGSPSFFSRAPSVVREFLASLPALDGLPAAVYVTSGGASGRALWDLGRALERRGGRVLGGAVFLGEVGFPARALRGRHKGLPGPAEIARAERFAFAAAGAASAAKTADRHHGDGAEAARLGGSPPSRPRGLTAPADGAAPSALRPTGRGIWGYYGLLGLLLAPAVVRRVLRVPVVDPAVCNRCRWCVGACPVGAVALEPEEERHMRPAGGGAGRPAPEIDPGVCIRCYRCLACPIAAYSLRWRPGAEALIGLLYHDRLVRHFGDPEARAPASAAE